MTRYLLGDLPEAERARFEEDYFTDDELFENYLAAKDELIDAYARGDLPANQRQQFEEHFLSTNPRRERLKEMKELLAFATAASASEGKALERQRGVSRWSFLFSGLRVPSPALGFAMGVVLLIAALSAVWILINRSQSGSAPRAGITPAVVPTEIPTPSPLPTSSPGVAVPKPLDKGTESLPGPPPSQYPSSPDKPAPAATHVASLFLTPLLTRDAGPSNTLEIGPDTSEARLHLSFNASGYRTYSASVQTIGGELVWRAAPLRARQSGASQSVVVNIPVRVFRKKDYIITLSGRTAEGPAKEINDYFFTIQRTNNP